MGSLFVHFGNRFQHGSAWYAQAIHITWHGKFFGQHDKNVTKIPISTPWTVIRTSEEGGGGDGQVLKGQCFEKKYESVLEKLFLEGRGSRPLVLHISSAHSIH